MSEEEKKLFEAIKYKNKCLFLVKVDADFLINLIENQQKELNNLKEIEKSHQEENGKLRIEVEQEKEHNKEYERIIDIWDERPYRKKYLEESRKEQPNLLYPDADEIYQKYYEEKEKNKELKAENFSLNEMKRYNQKHYISKDKIKELLENETIDISGFRCIAVEDIENLLEDK